VSFLTTPLPPPPGYLGYLKQIMLLLLQDQVERCLDSGIDTVTWNSETSESQRCSVEKELRGGEPLVKLIYTTPESLRTPRLLAALKVPPPPSPCLFVVTPFIQHALQQEEGTSTRQCVLAARDRRYPSSLFTSSSLPSNRNIH